MVTLAVLWTAGCWLFCKVCWVINWGFSNGKQKIMKEKKNTCKTFSNYLWHTDMTCPEDIIQDFYYPLPCQRMYVAERECDLELLCNSTACCLTPTPLPACKFPLTRFVNSQWWIRKFFLFTSGVIGTSPCFCWALHSRFFFTLFFFVIAIVFKWNHI